MPEITSPLLLAVFAATACLFGVVWIVAER
jgi:hypothetical protein